MVSSSVIRGLAFLAAAMPLMVTSCATSDPKVFAHPVAVSPSPMPVVTAQDGAVTSSATSSSQAQAPFLRALVGVDADRLGRELGVARENLHQSNNFVFVAPNDSSQLPHIAQLLEHTHGAFYEVFGGMKDRLVPPRSPLVWMLFDGRRDYETYARAADGMDMSWSKAYYSTQTNRVAISLQSDGDRMAVSTVATTATGAAALPLMGNDKLFAQITHEAGHQLAFNTGLQTRGVMYPLWASEGLAANFEMDTNGQLGPASQNVLRLRHLLTAMEDDRLIPLEHWVGYSRVPIGRPSQINAVYSQSWAFFRFLYEHRREHLHDYLAHMAKQQPGRRSEESLRRDFAFIFRGTKELNEPWNDFLAKTKEAHRLAAAQATATAMVAPSEDK